MAQREYFLVAESVSVDQLSNRASLFHILEEIHLPKFPYSINMVAASLWNRECGDEDLDFQSKLRIVGPDGKIQEYPQNFKMPSPRLRTFIFVNGFIVTSAGTLTIELLLNDKHRATHRIDVQEAPPQ